MSLLAQTRKWLLLGSGAATTPRRGDRADKREAAGRLSGWDLADQGDRRICGPNARGVGVGLGARWDDDPTGRNRPRLTGEDAP